MVDIIVPCQCKRKFLLFGSQIRDNILEIEEVVSMRLACLGMLNAPSKNHQVNIHCQMSYKPSITASQSGCPLLARLAQSDIHSID